MVRRFRGKDSGVRRTETGLRFRIFRVKGTSRIFGRDYSGGLECGQRYKQDFNI